MSRGKHSTDTPSRKLHEVVNNETLILDNLHHVLWELQYGQPSIFRVAREAHMLLYRMMVEALCGTANITVIKPNKRLGHWYYSDDEKTWYKIQKGPHPEPCNKAWRYTLPVAASEEEESFLRTQRQPGDLEIDFRSELMAMQSADLRGFYDLLAMIQTDIHMIQYCHSKSVSVSDKEMELLEWLHEEIRNEYEHFLPKTYEVCVLTLLSAAIACVNISLALLTISGNVFFRERHALVVDLHNTIRMKLTAVANERENSAR